MINNKINYFTPLTGIEQNALDQINDLALDENINQIAVFPDIHYCDEKAIPVGLAFSTKAHIYPLITGKDVGCGVAYMKIPKQYQKKEFDKEKHYNAFYAAHIKMTDEGLGGGNHFLSLEQDEENLYIIVHTGTRNRGIYMYQKHYSMLNGKNYITIDEINSNFPEWYSEYNDVLFYGVNRRKQFLYGTLDFLVRNGYVEEKDFYMNDSIHNHIKKESDFWIHRKGSTELNNDIVVVPLSMTRGSLLVKSTYEAGNLNSCSHGAGRALSRTKTLKYWYASLKKKERNGYKIKFSELLDRNGEFSKGYIQEFDFAYKDTIDLMKDQYFLNQNTQTTPICTIKFSEL